MLVKNQAACHVVQLRKTFEHEPDRHDRPMTHWLEVAFGSPTTRRWCIALFPDSGRPGTWFLRSAGEPSEFHRWQKFQETCAERNNWDRLRLRKSLPARQEIETWRWAVELLGVSWFCRIGDTQPRKPHDAFPTELEVRALPNAGWY